MKAMPLKTRIPSRLMAPCGMNCGICMGFLREKNKCLGCTTDSPQKPKSCLVCRIKTCPVRPAHSAFCFDCRKYPCPRLKQLDKRYRTKYGMSMIENLDKIKRIGLRKFMAEENRRWVCPSCGRPICVHNKKCYACGKVIHTAALFIPI